MNCSTLIVFAVAAVIAVVLFLSSAFTVRQTEQAADPAIR